MKILLKNEAVNEIVTLQKKVLKMATFVEHFGIYFHSDAWYATDCIEDSSNYDTLPHYNEDILNWTTKDFKTMDISTIDTFYIGGSLSSTMYEYKAEFTKEPKQIAQAKGEWVKQLLQDIVDNTKTKYFNIKVYDDGLQDNCGWEHPIGIKATIKENATINNPYKTHRFLENFFDNYIYDYVYTKYDDSYDNISTVSNLKGYNEKYACMIEIFSNLIDPSNYKPSELTGDVVTDEYIDAIVKERDRMRRLAKEIECRYKEQGIKVTLSKWNVGCQYGMAIYVWIPSQ